MIKPSRHYGVEVRGTNDGSKCLLPDCCGSKARMLTVAKKRNRIARIQGAPVVFVVVRIPSQVELF